MKVDAIEMPRDIDESMVGYQSILERVILKKVHQIVHLYGLFGAVFQLGNDSEIHPQCLNVQHKTIDHSARPTGSLRPSKGTCSRGLKPVTTAWSGFIGEEFKRRYYKNWYQSKQKKAFASIKDGQGKTEERIAKMAEAIVVRVIAHTQPKAVMLGARKAEISEIQINSGDVSDRVKSREGPAREGDQGRRCLR